MSIMDNNIDKTYGCNIVSLLAFAPVTQQVIWLLLNDAGLPAI
jgi:hypothetical protein